ncbi:PAS domain-containing sensor histidine kinase [Noviherbaspirillum sp. Root189]|uniref:PAS domain-containing sensor histidine kinase n=1 Tax=Noviherbaspirillum sp. Root189 TaxID=1736487 RepID=UPI0007101579|nr:PAS domain-containing sensor histidine kinase [Noviherbaspirillum sp. Root189]KRB84614.1 PAS domain-containing sensor histidine kinase [Noviherbaspirillum sp. Root189]
MPIDFNQLVLQETPDAIIVMAPDGKVVHWTRGAEFVFGYTAAEAAGRSLMELLVPADRLGEERRYMELARTAGLCSYESIRRRKDGSLVHVAISIKLIHDPQHETTYFLTTQKDVTSLKVLRDAKLLEAKFRDLLESTPDGIVMSNSTGHIVLANSQAERLFAYESGEMRGRPVESLLPARLRAGDVGQRSSYFAQSRPRAMEDGLELYGLRKDGTEFPVEISLSPLETEEGVLISIAIRDITERKRFERALYEKNLELEKANQAKDRFLASISHELRTPLNAIIGFTGTLLMRLPGPLTKDQEKQLRTVQLSAKHLLSLINDLLDLAKIESGKVELLEEPVSCTMLLHSLADTLMPLAQQKGLQFRLEMPDKEIQLNSDRRAINQILINLVNNAIKFTETGEVSVHLDEVTHEESSLVTIRVCDSGMGIPESDQEKLFEAFSQIDSSSTRRFEGTGLGLYLSQKLATLLRGKLTFSSEFGKGSIFTLTIPRDMQ